MAELETGSFDAVIDKGMTDSIMHNDNFAVMMAKVGRGCCVSRRTSNCHHS